MLDDVNTCQTFSNWLRWMFINAWNNFRATLFSFLQRVDPLRCIFIQIIPLCSMHLPYYASFHPYKEGQKVLEFMPRNIPFSLGYFVFPDSKFGRLPSLFISVFGSMVGKSERSKIQTYHARFGRGLLG